MAGLSLILETRKLGGTESTRKVINKTTVMVNNPSPPPPSRSPIFLDRCFLCGQKLLPGKDIYMYEGDKGFCSVECRCRQIFMDEEESIMECHCSLAARKPEETATAPSASASGSRRRKAGGNRAGGFAY